jgi:hypothetical protein
MLLFQEYFPVNTPGSSLFSFPAEVSVVRKSLNLITPPKDFSVYPPHTHTLFLYNWHTVSILVHKSLLNKSRLLKLEGSYGLLIHIIKEIDFYFQSQW